MVICYAAIANYNKLIHSFIQLSSARQAAGLAHKHTQPQSGLDFSHIQVILQFFIVGLKFKFKWVSFFHPAAPLIDLIEKMLSGDLGQILAFCWRGLRGRPGDALKTALQGQLGKDRSQILNSSFVTKFSAPSHRPSAEAPCIWFAWVRTHPDTARKWGLEPSHIVLFWLTK